MPDTNPVPAEEAVSRIAAFFEQLTLERVATLDGIYAQDARFEDPFNEVRGLPAIERVYRHMYASLQEPRFRITGRVVQGRQCFLTWDFEFRFRGFRQSDTQTVRGASHLLLDDAGRITVHRDYWDAAGELYEKIPALGALMRWLRRRAGR